ncbi:MAG: leucine--tRNA ligase [Armatimonadetes bacterium]|nr:leucine--tRNA ligase [Armatimonadota bacterium]
MLDRYEPKQFEEAWRKRWEDADLFRTREEEGRPKFYGLDFFPYPSGAGLSVGHCRNYIPTDVLCRMKFMQGYNVLHPMGFDAFGLPAENEAIKRKSHPAPMIDQYAATYKRQMDLVGISYDWSRSFKSCEPSYYRWTQWIFELLYKKGLAYRKNAEVNWCPKDKTALANEEVVGGLCERCGTPVEKKAIPQWYFKITDYAQRLLDDLDDIDWPEGIKAMQRNWIGRSEGVQFRMRVVFDPGTPSLDSDDRAGSGEGESELEALKREVAAETFADPDAEARINEIKGKLDAASMEVHSSDLGELPGFDSAKEKIDMAMARANIEKSGRSFDLDDFEVVKNPDGLTFEVFTTRIDTIYGVTFAVLAPEHPMVDQIIAEHQRNGDQRATIDAVQAYREKVKRETETERTAEGREKTGVFTGSYAVNPANGRRVPIWIADYVLMGYGTGAIMAVPAGDQRDFEFAVQFGIPVAPIQEPDEDWLAANRSADLQSTGTDGVVPSQALQRYLQDPKLFKAAFISKDKPLINAGEQTGMKFEEASKSLGEWIEACGLGQRKVQYRLRDWLISRQRYWGCPIPVCYGKDGEMMLIPENQLPVELPDVESYEPSDDGSSPLSRIQDFVNCTTPEGTLGRRETDTMGGFACSSWYFLRFCDPHNDDKAWDPKRVEHWMPVDTYVGGAEHAVMHLLYARFWTKVLFDAGLVPVKEPFQRLRNQGQVLGYTPYRKPHPGETLDVGEDGILISREEAAALPEGEVFWKWVRMSKSKGNVVTPEEAVDAFGADALRLFELFVAPFDADVEWTNDGMNGTARFLGRVFKLVSELAPNYDPTWRSKIPDAADEVRRATHKTIQRATDDIERFAFNTYVSALMEFLNELNDLRRKGPDASSPSWSEALETLVLLLAPGAPHSADELWSSLGKEGFTYHASWPLSDPKLAKDDVLTVAVQVNGKLRDTVTLPADASKELMETEALASGKVQAHLEGLTVRKVIVIPGKLVNIVAN